MAAGRNAASGCDCDAIEDSDMEDTAIPAANERRVSPDGENLQVSIGGTRQNHQKHRKQNMGRWKRRTQLAQRNDQATGA